MATRATTAGTTAPAAQEGTSAVAQRQGTGGVFVESLARLLGANATAGAVFAPAVEHQDVTVIPVAKVGYGFGSGRGRTADGNEGAGGGVGAKPLGYIELRDGQAAFHRIPDEWGPARIMAAGVAGWLVLRGLRRLLRR